MSKPNNKKRSLKVNSVLPKAPKLSKGDVISCAYVLGPNTPTAKKYSKGRHLKALSRMQNKKASV